MYLLVAPSVPLVQGCVWGCACYLVNLVNNGLEGGACEDRGGDLGFE